MKKNIFTTALVIVFVCCLFSTVYAQKIVFERTDVESKNADYVTATYSFGIDIRIDSIPNCSNVSFELSYNRVNYVKYSEYSKSEDWNITNNDKKIVTIIDANIVDYSSDRGIVAIEAGTGMPADIHSPNNPKVIHLEFVVTPAAIHNETLDFTIGKIRATYFKDTIVELVIPTTYKVTYKVHSYVNVWPGDVNCDGIVDAHDNAIISLFLTEPGLKARSFKRPNASNLWQPQMCIAWDTLAATFADCDGNGVVTTSDFAVVKLNYAKEHSNPCSTDVRAYAPSLQPDFEIGANTNIIPINIDMAKTDISGVAGIIDYSTQPDVKIRGIKLGGFFASNSYLHYTINDSTNITSFCVYDDVPPMNSNVVAYLYVDLPENQPLLSKQVTDLVGFDNNANITKLNQSTTSIKTKSDNDKLSAYYSNGVLTLNMPNSYKNNANIILYNTIGCVIAEITNNHSNQYQIILPNGVYLLTIDDVHTTFMVYDK